MQELRIGVTYEGRAAHAICPPARFESGYILGYDEMITTMNLYWETEEDREHYKMWIDDEPVDYKMWMSIRMIKGEI